MTFTTPKGIAVYPWLNKPDTKFKEAGEYRLKLRMSEDAAVDLIGKLRPLHDATVEAARKNPKRKGKFPTVYDFFSKVVDEDGNETGDVEFSFKRTASGFSKNTNQPWAIRPDMFDAKGRLASVKVFDGSEVRVNFEVLPYDTPQGVGIALRLQAVQVISP